MHRDDVLQCKLIALTAACSYAACVYFRSFLPMLAIALVPPFIMFFFWMIRHEYDTAEERVPIFERARRAWHAPENCFMACKNISSVNKKIILACMALLVPVFFGAFWTFVAALVIGTAYFLRNPSVFYDAKDFVIEKIEEAKAWRP